MTDHVRVTYGERILSCRIRESSDGGGRLVLHVDSVGRIAVDAPRDVSRAELKAGIVRQARWLCRQVDTARARHDGLTPREYVSGETHRYLGRRYLLRRLAANGSAGSVKLRGQQLQVRCDEPDAVRVKRLLDDWYRERAGQVFARRMADLLPTTPWVESPPAIRLRAMRGRWGSCSVAGRITLNQALVKAPPACIDGVLVHELCHVKVGNHGAEFYRLLDRALPDWRARKRRLDGMVEQVLHD